jgi:predicted RNA-binding protein with PIN domain
VKLLIDGHNLIGQMVDIDLGDPDDEAKLVDRLRRFARSGRHQVTVVFDGGSPGETLDLSGHSVKVVFAPAGRDADKVIIRRLKAIRDRQAWLIVTSDREILAAAAARHLRTESSESFAARLGVQPADPVTPDPRERPPSEAEVEMWLRRFNRR